MTVRTWEEQQAREKEMRRKWLQSIADQSKSIKDAANKAQMDRATMSRMASRYGVKVPKGQQLGRPNKRLEEYIKCAKAGMTMQETADHLGVSYDVVNWTKRQHDLPFKDARKGRPAGKPQTEAKLPKLKAADLPENPLDRMKALAAQESARMRHNMQGRA